MWFEEGEEGVDAFGVVLTIVVLVGVALFILLFEGRRATRIERDLRGMSGDEHDGAPRDRPPG